MTPDQGASPLPPAAASASDAFVSCLCVTHDRVALLQRAVACFLAQTHAARELVVLHEVRDRATAAYLAALGEPSVRGVEVPSMPKLTLGAKRNLGVAACKGDYLAIWDDDDWHAPNRLAVQLQVLKASGMAACTPRRVFVFDELTGQCYLSLIRQWECTLLARRDAMPPYANLDRGEDVSCIASIADAGQLTWLDAPQLYIYVYHGRNAGSRVHFRRNIFAHSQVLPPAFAARVRGLLEQPAQAPPLTLAEIRPFLQAQG